MEPLTVAIAVADLDIGTTISHYLQSLQYRALPPVSTCEDGLNLLETGSADLLIVDPGLNSTGDALALASVARNERVIPFVLIEQPNQAASLERFGELAPPAILKLPTTREHLQTTMETALKNFSLQQADTTSREYVIREALFVKHQQTYRKVWLKDISFLKSDHVYVELHTKSGDKWVVRSSLNRFMDILPANFCRIHRSFVANLDHLELVENNKVQIGSEELPLGRNYRPDLLNRIKLN